MKVIEVAINEEDRYPVRIHDLEFDEEGVSYLYAERPEAGLADTFADEGTNALPVQNDRILSIVERISDYGTLRIAVPPEEVSADERPIGQLYRNETIESTTIDYSESNITAPVSPRRLSFRGLKRVLASAGNLPSEVSLRASANIKTLGGSVADKIKSVERRPNKKIIALAVGGIALTAAIGAAYFETKGIGISHTNHSHEALQQAIPVKAPHQAGQAIQNHASAAPAKVPVNHEALKPIHKHVDGAINPKPTFTIEPGNGFTQELSQSFSPKGHVLSPEKSYKLFTAIRQHFGDHGILKHGKGLVDGTYNRNGEEYISQPGKAQWAKGVVGFAHSWLKLHYS